MKLKAEGNMVGALILIFIVIIASGVVAGYLFLRGSQVENGASISITSAQATPLANGQTYLTVSLVNTGSPGYVSISVYSKGTQVFFAPGASGLIYQIYYTPHIWVVPPEQPFYSASLSQGTTVSSNGLTWTAYTSPYTTPEVGTIQNVNGQNEPFVINNLQYGYTGGSASGVVAGYLFLRGSQVENGASISITSAQATPLANGQTYLTVSLVNTCSPGYVSISVYSGGTQVFFAPGAPCLIYQIYYDNNQWYQPPQNLVYSASLSPGTSFSAYGQT